MTGSFQVLCQNPGVTGFTVHSGKIAVYPENNVDTDRIIPARFLSRVSRSGYGELLFSDVRGGDFPLDRPEAQGASVLVVGTNFGCGSSREHAVWSIQQAGFRAVVALKTDSSPGYSDIFRQNSANCGLLLIELPQNDHQILVGAGSGAEVSINLSAQTVTLGQEVFSFDIAPATKNALIQGLDLIGTTLQYEAAIAKHEAESAVYSPERASR
ncbi:MAG TPA: 3-isopropylmalate dehydratase small subunit [Fimbriimonadaceae bacterium]|nr:3-isopropylmalate dehydratase small subunit [Fimbriimonadaceae bacterium]